MNRLKGSITLDEKACDSNPEGINQYTGGSSSKKAHDLTARANRVGTAEAHREAARAHFAASQQQRRNAESVAAKSGHVLRAMSPARRETYNKYLSKEKEHKALAAAHRDVATKAEAGKRVIISSNYEPPSSIWPGTIRRR